MTPSMRTMGQPTELSAQGIHQCEQKNDALFYFGGYGDYLFVREKNYFNLTFEFLTLEEVARSIVMYSLVLFGQMPATTILRITFCLVTFVWCIEAQSRNLC